MNDSLILKVLDWVLKPQKWYVYDEPVIEGYRLIASKIDQNHAGQMEAAAAASSKTFARKFGLNPIKPYRDYYGGFRLKTKLLAEPDAELDVKFAIGYTINNKVVTVDDYSNFGWLRLAVAREGMLYPNLSDQKQLLEFLLQHSECPRFVVTRVYHYLQFEMYEKLTTLIFERENGFKHF